MSVRKAAGLEPSGLIAPRLGEVVSKAEVEAAARYRVIPYVEPSNFGNFAANGVWSRVVKDNFLVPSDYVPSPPFYGKSLIQSMMDNLAALNEARDAAYAANDDQQPAPAPALPSGKQVGKFIVPHSTYLEVERLSAILEGVIVIGATPRAYPSETEYVGLHVDFAETPAGGIVRYYTPVISNGKRVWR